MANAPLPEGPNEITGLVDYQAGSVVSRTIAKTATGTVTLFAFDAGESLSEHTAPFDALIHVLDGGATITIGGKAHEVAAGQLIRLPANVPHAVKATRRFKMMIVMLRAG